MILRFLGSLQLTLSLLLGLAVVSVFGTLRPAADNRYEVFYQTPWFRLGLALLALNLLVCTVKTLRRNLQARSNYFDILGGEQVYSYPLRALLPGDRDPDRLAARLRRSGFRLDSRPGRLLARRGAAGRWGSTLVHLSVLAIMLGALAGEFGFVGTLTLHVGRQSPVYFDWEAGQDLPLGFELRLDHFEPRYYPIELQFEAIAPRTGQTLASYTVKEGDEVDLPVPGLSARVRAFLPFEKRLVLDLFANGAPLGEYRSLPGTAPLDNTLDPGIELRPTAFRDPVLRQMHSEVSIIEDGRVVRRGVIEVNHPLVHKGVSIYQTAFDRDKYGFYFGGFQLSRDPGEPVVWVCSILLVAGLLAAFLIPYRVLGVVRHGDELLLVALAGFRGEAGLQAFERLERALADQQRFPS